MIEDAQRRFAAAVVTQDAYPRDRVEDTMVCKSFCEAVNEFAHKAGETVEGLEISTNLTAAEWKLVCEYLPFVCAAALPSCVDCCSGIPYPWSHQTRSP